MEARLRQNLDCSLPVLWRIGLILLLFPITAKAQQPAPPASDTLRLSDILHTMPLFPGGTKKMARIIEENMRYPKTARKDRVGGRVVVQFMVDTTGAVVDIQTVERVREDIDQEAMRLISLLKGWTPGTIDGKKVRVQYQLPLNFYPDNKWKKAYLEAKAKEGIAH